MTYISVKFYNQTVRPNIIVLQEICYDLNCKSEIKCVRAGDL